MKPPPFEYHAAGSAAEAISLLAEYGEDAKVLAGGQSLIPLLALRMSRPGHLIDVNGAGDLAGISGGDGLHSRFHEGLRCGALTRHRVAERSEAIAAASPLLSEAARFIGHAAIRNRGTIGGSIAHADPAAELPAVLLALDGEVEAASARGSRRIPAAGFFLGYLTTVLAPDELVTAVHFPSWAPGTGWSFTEFSRRSGDFAIIGVAATLRLDDRGTIADARLAISGAADTAVRPVAAEAALRGQHPGDGTWAAAARDALAGLDLPEDLHGSAAYRRHLAAALIERALRSAYQRTPACQQLGVPA
jgi:carbon-monoxide dehydrogenase medium subunit